jgi:hypothetical protein
MFPLTDRVALEDTTLPSGGGPDQAPIVIQSERFDCGHGLLCAPPRLWSFWRRHRVLET